MEVAYIADLVLDNSDNKGEQNHQQQQQQPLLISSMPPHNKVDSLNSASSESEYDSPDLSVEPDHVTSMPFTSLPTSTLPRSSTSLPVSFASVLCKPPTQQHKLMLSQWLRG